MYMAFIISHNYIKLCSLHFQNKLAPPSLRFSVTPCESCSVKLEVWCGTLRLEEMLQAVEAAPVAV